MQSSDAAYAILKDKLAGASYTEEQKRKIDQQCQENLQRERGSDPNCPICQGAGYLWRENGRHELCSCMPAKSGAHTARSGLEVYELDYCWEQVQKTADNEPALLAISEVLMNHSGWVYLWGPPGLGKTFMLKTAVAVGLNQGKPGAYTQMSQVMDTLRQASRSDEPGGQNSVLGLLDWWAGLPLLAIDELDRMRGTPFAQEYGFQLMDQRYEDAVHGQGMMLMASNLPPDKYEPYLTDRICDVRFKVVHITGKSWRTKTDLG